MQQRLLQQSIRRRVPKKTRVHSLGRPTTPTIRKATFTKAATRRIFGKRRIKKLKRISKPRKRQRRKLSKISWRRIKKQPKMQPNRRRKPQKPRWPKRNTIALRKES